MAQSVAVFEPSGSISGAFQAPEGPYPFPCRISPINSNGDADSRICSESFQLLSSSGRKSRFALESIVSALVSRFALERIGFLTLTFGDHVVSPVEASRRFNSLRTGVLASRYSDVVRVFERQRSGRIHYHLLVVCPADIRRGVDFQALGRRDYRSASSALRAEWLFWRRMAPRYGFGRCELLPIRKGARDLSAYVGKYVSKHCAQRLSCDRGVRLVSCSRRARVATTRFSWAYGFAARFRRGVPLLLAALQAAGDLPFAVAESASKYFGRHWRYRFRESIGLLGDDAGLGSDFYREVSREWRSALCA